MSSTPSILPDLASNVTTGTTLPSSSPSSLFSKVGHLKASASNVTLFLNPSPKDLLMALPRAIARVGSFAFFTVPERIDDLLGLRNGGSIIAEATGERANKTVLTTLSGTSSVQGIATVIAESVTATEGTQKSGLSHVFTFQHVRNFGGVFTYMTSRWALSCFTLVSLKRDGGDLGLKGVQNRMILLIIDWKDLSICSRHYRHRVFNQMLR